MIKRIRRRARGDYASVTSKGLVTQNSEEADVAVHVPVIWELWGDWSECKTKNGGCVRQRTRSSLSSAPIEKGGKY